MGNTQPSTQDYYPKSIVDAYLLTKADKLPGATSRYIIVLDSNGNIASGGVSIDSVFVGNFADGGTF